MTRGVGQSPDCGQHNLLVPVAYAFGATLGVLEGVIVRMRYEIDLVSPAPRLLAQGQSALHRDPQMAAPSALLFPGRDLVGNRPLPGIVDFYTDLFPSDLDSVAQNVAKMWPPAGQAGSGTAL